MTSCEEIIKTIKSYRFRYQNEAELQLGIAKALEIAGIAFVREKEFGKANRIDFYIDNRIGLEVKIKGSPSSVTRQLLRYANCDGIQELILVTGRARLGQLPETLNGKRIFICTLWETAFL